MIVGTVYGSNNYLHKFSKSTGAISEYSETTSTKEFSAIGPYTGNYFFTAVTEYSDSTNIYKSSPSNIYSVKIFSGDTISATDISAITYDRNIALVVFAAKVGNDTKIYSMQPNGINVTLRQTFSTSNVPAMTILNNKLYTVRRNTGSSITTLYCGSYADPDSSSISLSSTEIISINGWCNSNDYLYSIKNIGSDGDKKLYFTDAPLTNVFKDILFYSRWWLYF